MPLANIFHSLPAIFDFLHILIHLPISEHSLSQAIIKASQNTSVVHPPSSEPFVSSSNSNRFTALLSGLTLYLSKVNNSALNHFQKSRIINFVRILIKTKLNVEHVRIHTAPNAQFSLPYGSSGALSTIVYKAILSVRDPNDDELWKTTVALKTCPLSKEHATHEHIFQQEALRLRTFSHPCIPAFFGSHWPEFPVSFLKSSSTSPPPCALLATEFLSHNLYTARQLLALHPLHVRLQILLDVADAIAYLHGANVYHARLTPSNILLHIQGDMVYGRAKIDVSGIVTRAVLPSNILQLACQSLLFLPPETIQQSSTVLSGDVWGFGMLACYLILHPSAFLENASAYRYAVAAVGKGAGLQKAVDDWCAAIPDERIRAVISGCLRLDPTARLNAQNLLSTMKKILDEESKSRQKNVEITEETIEESVVDIILDSGASAISPQQDEVCQSPEKRVPTTEKTLVESDVDVILDSSANAISPHQAQTFVPEKLPVRENEDTVEVRQTSKSDPKQKNGAKRKAPFNSPAPKRACFANEVHGIKGRLASNSTPEQCSTPSHSNVDVPGPPVVSLSSVERPHDHTMPESIPPISASNAPKPDDNNAHEWAPVGNDQVHPIASERKTPDEYFRIATNYDKGIGVVRNVRKAAQHYRLASDFGHLGAIYKLAGCFEEGRGVEKSLERAAWCFELAAKAGDLKSMIELGRLYEEGLGVMHSPKLAVKWYQTAAEKGSAEGSRCLGQCYLEGFGVEMDKRKAVVLFDEARKGMDIKSNWELGNCYREGAGVDVDYVKACMLYRVGALAGHSEAERQYGLCLYHGEGTTQDYVRALEMFKEGAKQEDAESIRMIGECYECGRGVPQNDSLAVEHFRKAADLGSACATTSLACCYERGDGVTKNIKKALSLYKKACEDGDYLAYNNLGVWYEAGVHVKQDYSRAVMYYKKAKDLGYSEATCNLADCYISGHGVTKDLSKGIELFREAAEEGHAASQCELGSFYYSGKGVSKDQKRAVELFKKACSKSAEPEALRRLGVAHCDGYGVTQNFEKAYELFSRASEAGNAEAHMNLGTCYDEGLGVKKCLKTALSYYRKAAEGGCKAAYNYVGNMYFEGRGVKKDRNIGFKFVIQGESVEAYL